MRNWESHKVCYSQHLLSTSSGLGFTCCALHAEVHKVCLQTLELPSTRLSALHECQFYELVAGALEDKPVVIGAHKTFLAFCQAGDPEERRGGRRRVHKENTLIWKSVKVPIQHPAGRRKQDENPEVSCRAPSFWALSQGSGKPT